MTPIHFNAPRLRLLNRFDLHSAVPTRAAIATKVRVLGNSLSTPVEFLGVVVFLLAISVIGTTSEGIFLFNTYQNPRENAWYSPDFRIDATSSILLLTGAVNLGVALLLELFRHNIAARTNRPCIDAVRVRAMCMLVGLLPILAFTAYAVIDWYVVTKPKAPRRQTVQSWTCTAKKYGWTDIGAPPSFETICDEIIYAQFAMIGASVLQTVRWCMLCWDMPILVKKAASRWDPENAKDGEICKDATRPVGSNLEKRMSEEKCS